MDSDFLEDLTELPELFEESAILPEKLQVLDEFELIKDVFTISLSIELPKDRGFNE